MWVLLDPDRQSPREAALYGERCEQSGADMILVGTSMLLNGDFEKTVDALKSACGLPVVIFPASATQVCSGADAILYLSLVSGRNPQYLIEEQVRSAPLIRRHRLEAVSTAYMLIGSGGFTAVNYISNTMPIPGDKTDIAVAHAMAASYIGMKLIYLEGGSGAAEPVPLDMIKAVKEYVDLPIICGGGLREPEQAAAAAGAGADVIVVGSAFEQDRSRERLIAFRDAVQ